MLDVLDVLDVLGVLVLHVLTTALIDLASCTLSSTPLLCVNVC